MSSEIGQSMSVRRKSLVINIRTKYTSMSDNEL